MRKATSGEPTPGASATVDKASASAGQPLPADLRGQLEHGLDHDLSGVRVHTGADSAGAAEGIAAKAFTRGNDIHFGAGHYDPGSTTGQHLLAHEVAHTVQQRGVAKAVDQRAVNDAAELAGVLNVSQPSDALEHQAEVFADAFVTGGARVAVSPGTAPTGIVARKADDDFESHPEEQSSGKTAADLYRTHGPGKGTMRHQTPLLTEHDVYGAADKRQANAKNADRRDRAKYNLITRVSSGVRFERLWQSLKSNRPTSFAEFFSHGLSKGLVHKWERPKFRALYADKEGKSEKELRRIEYRDRVKAREAFIAQAEGVKFNVTSQAFQQVLLAPVLTAVDVAMLVDKCSKSPRECIGALLTAKTRAGASVGRFAAQGVQRQARQAQEKLRRIEEVIAKAEAAKVKAQRDYTAAVARLKAVASRVHSLPGPFADPEFVKAIGAFASAFLRKGMRSSQVFIAQINKTLKANGLRRLTKKGEAQAEGMLSKAKTRQNWGTPRTPGKKRRVKTKAGKKGKWNKKLNNPKPNRRYEVDGYTYVTDGEGRTVEVIASKLRKKTRDRNTGQQVKAGGKDRLPDDQGGHAVGSQFDGPGEAINLFAQNVDVNKSIFSKLEGVWQKALDEGKQVSIRIRVRYPKGSKRPKSFLVDYRIGNKLYTERIKNKAPKQ